ncbi:hypothetical protein PDIG_48890 [Penicillium digitatum PHI26]|uniref:Uncharacterized protein n=2 Tax=Penicillium digitatum TaxID=36651 RepID=K9G9T6_PEND2|nr:hypothetical protein PDIP_58270 [Penicillium digitatum Pd1]EKV10813.1 hypothetical protein PDIP_58270 [Penicillium digitatum Pd1]EKV11663.1 hypothetical protein PDIG_48890 [Penicillium digitatum PHI26]
MHGQSNHHDPPLQPEWRLPPRLPSQPSQTRPPPPPPPPPPPRPQVAQYSPATYGPISNPQRLPSTSGADTTTWGVRFNQSSVPPLPVSPMPKCQNAKNQQLHSLDLPVPMSNDMPIRNLSRIHLSQLLFMGPKPLRPHLRIYKHHRRHRYLHHPVFHNCPQRSHKASNMYQPNQTIRRGGLHCSLRAQDQLR